ncbi:MAG: UDP-N-acetylmuramoyl-L-alanine--D-glutamate ligase [Caulobacterales bacterium]|nr:UDP-N-acetylmuramoyl-L-alanine--D-glutamate ligase [Caulobacterales bacterium]
MIPARGFEGREVAVFGLGRSGLTAARALKAGGAVPVLWDDSVSGRMQAEAEGFSVEDLASADWNRFAALMLAPGVPLTHPRPHWTVVKAREAGVEVLGDIELFQRTLDSLPGERRPKVVAITGTNGKSTTTALIGWVLKQAGIETHVGGNIGIGVLALPEPTPGAVYVIEVSSYQLDLTAGFAPDVAILTNLSPDHLDRHGGMEGYVAAKSRLFANPRDGSVASVGVDDGWGLEVAVSIKDQWPVVAVSTRPSPLGAAEITGGAGWIEVGDAPIDLTSAASLPGRHNAENAAFAYAAVRALGVSHEQIVAGLMSFPGLAHRMETVAQIGKVRFVNDSKATNADAARQALSSYDRLFWIAGGRAKDGGIDSLVDLFPRIARAFLIGEAAQDFAQTLGDVPHAVCVEMDRAVEMAYRAAADTGREEVVLLSPACASFDQYPDFEARGEAFRAAVRRITDEEGTP